MKVYILLFLLNGLLLSCKKEKSNVSIEQSQETIRWDNWGIPHIYAKTDTALYTMAGWSQMTNHANLILKLYGESRGKSSEYFGTGLERDTYLNLFGLTEYSETIYNKFSEEERMMVNAFVEGINLYAEKNKSRLNKDNLQVLPVVPTDVVAHYLRLFYFEFLINRNLSVEKKWVPGSNGWVVNSRKTTKGSPLLLANPHLPWFDFWMFFECQYITPKQNLYGVTLVGLPTIGIGFNENLGWTHTVNPVDNVDFYEIQTKDNTYLVDAVYKPFITDTLLIKASKKDSNSIKEVIRNQTDYGVVLREVDNKALVLKFPDLSTISSVFLQWKAMGSAKNFTEFKTSISKNSLPLFNTLYADKQDTILYYFGGKIPKKKGSFKKWENSVPSQESSDIWSTYYSYDELPKNINPTTGWLQNANDGPFTATIPTEGEGTIMNINKILPNTMGFRAQRSALLLSDTAKISFDDFTRFKFDTKSQLAMRLQDDIVALKSISSDSLQLAAINILENWDGDFRAESTQAVLFLQFVDQLYKNVNFRHAIPWSIKKPLTTPDGFLDPEIALVALQKATKHMMSIYGSLEIKYGKLYKFAIGEYEFPANGGSDDVGIFRTITFMKQNDHKYLAVHGDSYISVVQFGDTVKAKAILSYGNATEKSSGHVGDQLELFSKKQLRTVLFSKQQQLQCLKKEETFRSIKLDILNQ
ncbi:penicillin acylase family protein [Aquimarina intermedia]|uniref:Acyl-homoserine-lactone acylase n=1 Tax=Aquimarina intermedia TaxID=350814 RepID=A0A5S5C8M8_9FLAO|nr:penicillin acylase family protein [Aquimarina intermedia]TYP74343.1 acyl-homoserine-lactone acylase [Aquimarina intermedia]